MSKISGFKNKILFEVDVANENGKNCTILRNLKQESLCKYREEIQVG